MAFFSSILRVIPFLLTASSVPVVAQSQSTSPPTGFNIYGQINRGFLTFDDGVSEQSYWFVDNSKSVSRLGITYDQPLNDVWRLHARGEIALRWKETNAISQSNPTDVSYKFDRRELRKLEAEFIHDRFGKFTIGQGAMAADGITGLDLSLTTVVAGTPVQDAAGGQRLQFSGGTLSERNVKEVFRSMGSSRRLRLRYDAPITKGWRFVAAYGQEALASSNSFNHGLHYGDASLRYDGDHGNIRLRAGGAYRWIEDTPDVFIASGSILHRPSGWNATVATGYETSDARYSYVKIGYIGRWFDVGHTAISIDIYDGKNIYVRSDADIGGGSSRSYGLAIVQRIKSSNMDIYGLLRRYEYTEASTDFRDATAFLTGIRWTF